MYKIIDLGTEFSATGEPRARILDHSLVKTASSEIQEYWDKLERNDKFAYLWVIGVSAMEYYGCNNNGDAFSEADLKKTIPDWAANAHIFVHHVNKDPRKSIGKPIYAWYNDEMHRVELVLAIDRNANGASAIVERIKNGEQMYVSMGCNVAYDVCSICGHQSKTRAEYCDHLRFNMKRILPDGKQVYAFNPNPKFFDISIVTRPADPTAFALDKIASDESTQNVQSKFVKSSAELGEEAEDLLRKAASVHKLADIIKQVDGEIVDSLIDPDIKPVRDIAACGFDDFDYPEIPYSDLDHIGCTPLCFAQALGDCGSPLSLADAYWMSGLSRTGFGLGKALSLLPVALSILENNPERITPCISDVFAGNEPDSLRRVLTVQIIKPVTVKRIAIIKRIPVVQKVASESAFAQMHVQDAAGNVVRTTPYYLDQARSGHIPRKVLGGLLVMAAIGSLISAPDLAQKLGIGGLFGVPAMSLIMEDTDRSRCIVHNTGEELPATLVNQAFKMPAKTAAVSFGTTVGLAAPAAVALDYAYNKWKSNREGMPEPNNPLHNLGRTIVDHPGVSLLAGGVAGAITHHGAKKALEALKNRWKK